MSDTSINRFLAQGDDAAEAAFTPVPPTPASGPDPLQLFLNTEATPVLKYWDGAAFQDVPASANIQTLLDTISTTQGVVLYYNGTDWVALSPGTSGEFLQTQGAGANPQWAAGGGGAGAIAQVVTATFDASATGTGLIPVDNSIPQSGEGDEYMTLTITPTNASSTLLVQVNTMVGSSVSRYTAVALFRDAGADAIGVSNAFVTTAHATMNLTLNVPVAAGSTSATTFKVRIGGNTAGTTTFNGAAGGRLYGAIPTSTMSITEVLP